MDYWHDIDAGTEDCMNVIVEIPKGSQNKYELDKKTGIVKLDRVLFSPMHYPGDYGMIPQTLGEDGDPLDGLVLVTRPTFPGCLIEARPIGVLKMVDGGDPDDKILCVPTEDPRFSDFKDLSAVPKPILNEIAHFFQVYKTLEGKSVEIVGWEDVSVAKKIFNQARSRYKEKFSK
ncbi:inorganic diphosphatase [Candidatus Woesearchaeota archaeon]|nr:MAG: inorganic diphosphatase [Candidatus Woesearchaeota archaeon]